jgi:peptidoglycan/LPS O-acetylase OafA/YrhL
MSHLWSLAVEEQFYLIWPWLILFVPRKWTGWLIMTFILTGTISNYLVAHRPLGTVLTFTCFDAFGLGALLAWLYQSGKENVKRYYPYFMWAALISAILVLIGIWRFKHDIVPLRTLFSLISLWLFAYIILKQGEKTIGWFRLLENDWLVFLGKISYGIYLYHNFVPVINHHTLSAWLDHRLPESLQPHLEKIHFGENIILLVLLSWLSFELIEKRFLSLKKYVEYSPAKHTQAV